MTADREDGIVVVYAPDTSLKEKLGRGIKLENFLTAEVIEEGQKLLVALDPVLMEENLGELARIEQAAGSLMPGHVAGAALATIVEAAFAIKSRAGMNDYPLASTLAKSLHMFAEIVLHEKLSAKQIEVMRCLVMSIKTLFEQQLKGTGGATGKAIVSEAQRLIAQNN